jgi:uncharacterized protein
MPLLLCPNCQTGMQEINRNSVQIDVCTNCRGVWLDRGELEKLLGAVQETEKEWKQERDIPYQNQSENFKDDESRRRQYKEHYDKPDKQEHYTRVGGYRKKSAFERLSDFFD